MYTPHTIELNQIKGYVATAVLGSSSGQDGSKRLYVKAIAGSLKPVSYEIEYRNRRVGGDVVIKKFRSLERAVEFYNGLMF